VTMSDDERTPRDRLSRAGLGRVLTSRLRVGRSAHLGFLGW
jgi:hypothetical protein